MKKAAVKQAATKKSKKKAKKKSSSKRDLSKRDLMTPNGDARYVRHDKDGHFKESDDVGRSQKADRLKKAKRVAKSGEGDKGDRKIVKKGKAKKK